LRFKDVLCELLIYQRIRYNFSTYNLITRTNFARSDHKLYLNSLSKRTFALRKTSLSLRVASRACSPHPFQRPDGKQNVVTTLKLPGSLSRVTNSNLLWSDHCLDVEIALFNNPFGAPIARGTQFIVQKINVAK